MAKNIAICSDGTGNTWSEQTSNVARLVQAIELSRTSGQIAFYDQGIGTDPKLVSEVQAYKDKEPEQRCGLTVLDPPYHPWWMPEPIARRAGSTVGYGLRRNVKELYTALANNYEGKDGEGTPDSIYLFGFSRGAFTVRTLAGLICHCGLLPPDAKNFAASFEEAYRLYKRRPKDCDEVIQFRNDEHVRSPRIHFLGLWDTVKSYGGIWPQSLPHLRRNPIVIEVRHALALDEQRSWFLPTSWGGIDGDLPMTDPGYENQHVVEIWFRGSHSDVGGGYTNDAASTIPLRWMLNEAAACKLRLNKAGRDLAMSSDPVDPPCIHDSFTDDWLKWEYVPRWELDNHFDPPKRYFKCGRTGARHPSQFARKQTVWLHSSVGLQRDIVTSYVETVVASTLAAPDDEAAII